MKVVREMYTNDDFEDRKKMVKMEKEKMRKEIEELRNGKVRGDWT